MIRARILPLSLLAALLAVAPATAQKMDLTGRSYGGKVRAQPSMGARQVGSTQLNDPIVLLERSVAMNGYDWFLIMMPNGRTGYQWGGLLCADSEETGMLAVCGSAQDAELSGQPGQSSQSGRSRRSSGRQVASADPESDVSYTCNEGIPLTVRYRDEGRESVAYVSHDSLPEIRLVQVRSGSGVQFQSGPYWMGGKGPELSLDFDGITDTCFEVN